VLWEQLQGCRTGRFALVVPRWRGLSGSFIGFQRPTPTTASPESPLEISIRVRELSLD
jgi:hypothetical protein